MADDASTSTLRQRCLPYLVCPITHDVMSDPVVDTAGISYERGAVLQWVASSNRSPFGATPMCVADLVRNHALRAAIRWLAAPAEGAGADVEAAEVAFLRYLAAVSLPVPARARIVADVMSAFPRDIDVQMMGMGALQAIVEDVNTDTRVVAAVVETHAEQIVSAAAAFPQSHALLAVVLATFARAAFVSAAPVAWLSRLAVLASLHPDDVPVQVTMVLLVGNLAYAASTRRVVVRDLVQALTPHVSALADALVRHIDCAPCVMAALVAARNILVASDLRAPSQMALLVVLMVVRPAARALSAHARTSAHIAEAGMRLFALVAAEPSAALSAALATHAQVIEVCMRAHPLDARVAEHALRALHFMAMRPDMPPVALAAYLPATMAAMETFRHSTPRIARHAAAFVRVMARNPDAHVAVLAALPSILSAADCQHDAAAIMWRLSQRREFIGRVMALAGYPAAATAPGGVPSAGARAAFRCRIFMRVMKRCCWDCSPL
jgi:hypothetical protein